MRISAGSKRRLAFAADEKPPLGEFHFVQISDSHIGFAADANRDDRLQNWTPREEIDRGDEERQQQGDEHDLDRPAPDDAVADPDGAARSLHGLEPLVERAEQLLRRAPHPRQPLRVQPRGGVAEGAPMSLFS